MKRALLAILLIGPANPAFGQSYISRVYCAVLGNTEIKKEYKDLVHQALKKHGVVDPEQVSVKKMNTVGQIIALMPLASFTAFGVWFNEEYLDACSPEERTFQIYHEAAHYAQQHHQKILLTTAVLSGAVTVGLIALNKLLQKNNNPHSLAITAVASAITAATIYLGILPCIVKHQEKEADLEACKQLVDHTDIIKARIQALRRSGRPFCANIWWFSDNEQAAYLEQAIQ